MAPTSIGNKLDSDDNIMFHGPLTIGNNLAIEDDVVLFRFTRWQQRHVRTGANVVGMTLCDGVTVPDGAVIATQSQADALN